MSMSGFRRVSSGGSNGFVRRSGRGGSSSGGGSDREARDTGHIYTQTELDESIERNQKSAEQLRADFIGSITGRQDAALQDVEESGFSKVLRGVGSILDVIDRPRRLVALGLQDIAEMDQHTEITAGHYWDVAMGRKEETVKNLGADVVGERGDISGSVLLDSMGWKKTDNWFNKVARFAGQATLEVGLDPASYFTAGSSAVGGKAALQSMEALTAKAVREGTERILAGTVREASETAFERGIRESIEAAADPIRNRIVSELRTEVNGPLTNEVMEQAWQKAVREAAGYADDFAEEIGLDAAKDLAAGVFARKVDELAEPIATRRWDQLPSEYIDHVFTKRNGERLGDAFTTGGIRLGVPFSMRAQTRALPGTRGLMRRLPGVRQLSKIPQSRFGQRFGELAPLVDANAPILQAAKRGEGYAMLSYAENLTRAAARQVGNAQAQRNTLLAAQNLDNVMTTAGLDASQKDEVWRLIYPSMQVGQVAPDVSKHGDAVVKAAQEFVENAHSTIGSAYQFLRKIDPNGVGFIESHIPLMFGDEFTRAMQTIAGSRRGMPFTIDTAEDAQRIADELGVSVEKLWLFMEAFDGTTTIGRRGLRNTGSKSVIRKRRTGRTATSRRGTFTTVDENGRLVFMRRPQEMAATEVDDDLARIASGEYADEVRRTAGYAAKNEDAVPQLITSMRVTESRLPARQLAGAVESPKTGEVFRVYRAAEDDRYVYTVVREGGEVMGGVLGSSTNFSMGLADDARGVMDQVWDIALENGHDLLKIHGKGASTSEAALQFGQRRAQRLVKEATGGGNVMTDVATSQRAWMDQGEISDALAEVTNAINKRYNLGLKDIEDGLTRDPVKLVGDYLAQMQALAQQRALRQAATFLGGITQVRTATNLEPVLDAVADAGPTVENMLTRIAERNQESIVDILTEEPKLTRVQVGGGRYVEIPSELAEHRRIKPLINKIRNMSQRIEGQRRTLQKARAREARNLVDTTGMSPQMAADIVNATTGDMAALRAEFLAEVEAVTAELQEAATEAWFRTARDGVDAQEALAVLIARRHDLKVRARKSLAEAEEAWAEQFPEILDEFEDVDVPLRFMNYDDPVQYAEGVQKIFGPVVTHLAEQRQKQLEAIQARIAQLTEERTELMERILRMGDEKNTRSLTVGPGMQQTRTRLEARVGQIDKQVSGLDSLLDYVGGARTADDIHDAVIFQEVARDLSNAATSEAAIAWDGPVQAGVQRIYALLDAGGLDEATAKSARQNVPAIADAWEAFVRASEDGATSLSDEVFDSPWFWRVIANGYLAQRDAVREAAEQMRGLGIRDGLDAVDIDETIALYEALHMPDLFQSIGEAVDDKIARIMQLADDAPNSGHALEQLGDLYDALPNRRSQTALVAASPEERSEMVAEMVAFYTQKRSILDAENEELWINELGRYLRAYLTGHQQNLTARIAATGAGEEVGGSAYALDRVIRDVLQAVEDPQAAMRAIKDQGVLQDAFERVYPNMKVRLVLSGDGFRIRMSKIVPTSSKVRPPEPKKILELLQEGRVTPDQLRDNGLGYVADLFELRRSFAAAQKRVASARRSSTRQLAEAARIRNDYEDLLNTITSVMGSGRARPLRDWVHTGTAKGAIVRTDRYRKLLNVLPQNEAEQLDRVVQRALYLAELPSGDARTIARLTDEDFWLERLYEPMERATERLVALVDDIRAESVGKQVAEVEQFNQLAEEFASHLHALQTLARDTNEAGLATAGNRLAEHTILGDRTAAEVIDDLEAAAKALEGAAPPGMGKAEIKAFLARLDDASEQVPLPTEGVQAAERLGLGGQLQGQEIDPLVAAMFRNMIASHDAMFTPQGLSSMRKAAHEVLRWWRGAATVARVPFHARNLISALANGMLISVGPKQYARVMPDYVAYRKALHAGEEALDAVSPANRALFEAAIREEVIGSGFVRSELGVALGTGGAKAKLNPADADNFLLFRGGAEMMQTLEDSVRLAAFARWFDESVPETAKFARQMVMVAHFDYQHLGEMEQKLKAVAPFFVWTRRNVPLQLRAIVEAPAYITTFGHISNAMKDNFGSDDRPNMFSPYASSLAAPLPFGEFGGDETWSRFIFDPDLPFDNLEDFPLFANRRQDSPLPFGAGAISPSAWIKWGTQLVAPQWSFAGQAAYGEAYQTNAPTGLNEILRLLNTVDFFDMIQDPSAAGDVKVSNMTAQAWRTAIPFATEYTDFFGSNSPTREARFGFTNEPESLGDRLRAFGQSQFASGLGLSRQTPSDLRGRTFDAGEFVKEQSLRLRERMPQG